VGLDGGVVLGERAAAAADLAGALAGQEAKMAVAGVLELAVGHRELLRSTPTTSSDSKMTGTNCEAPIDRSG
jgi:hypothetical protein